jgi:hypothetical protein
MTKVLKDLSAAQKRIAELEAIIAAANAPKALSVKMNEKGTISVYGLGRFPVSLYRDQWSRLIEFAPKVTEFMSANAKRLVELQDAYNSRKTGTPPTAA